ncbi:MAG: TolC family protein [Gemmataceae bacterium]
MPPARLWPRRLARAGLVALSSTALTGPTAAQPPRPAEPPAAQPAAPTRQVLSLGECLAIAHERQPRIKAAQHSLNATLLGGQALNNLRPIVERLSPDIPVRRMQSDRGATVAVAELQKVQQETTYDVTWLYYSFVYARQAEQTAADVIVQMETYYDAAKGILESGVKPPGSKLDSFTLARLQRAIGAVRKLQIKAESGKQAALAALKEAMGVDQTCDLTPKDTELPLMLSGSVTQGQVVAEAVSRRPELAQAAAGVDVFRLEVLAQSKVGGLRQQISTFATGTDLHSRQVPMAVRNGTYRPGAIAPEMPTSLVGNKEDRVARACEYSQRQDALYETILGLVKLEAVNAYLEWEASSSRMREAKRVFDLTRQTLEQARTAAATRQDPQLVVETEADAGVAQADYLEAVLDHIRALAKLERVTAGGVRAGFPGR